MFHIEKNYILNIVLLLFIAFTFVYRYWDVFFKKYGCSGKIHFGWSLYFLAIVHSLVGIFSVCEYFLFRHRSYNFIIGFIALLLFVIGQIIRNFAIISLKGFHSGHIEIKSNHQLIKTGPYNLIRNPYYVGVLVEVLCTPLVLNAYYSFFFAVITEIGWKFCFNISNFERTLK